MRIIAGKHRGRILKDLKHSGTRPTSDRVREALFSSIQNDIRGGVVLDLFSGTGALGLEALSRGSYKVYCVDNNIKSFDLIKQNNNFLKESANILHQDFKTALTNFVKEKIRFNVIFLDPPYASVLAEEAMTIIATNKMLLDNGVIVFEHDKEKLGVEIPKGLRAYSQKKYGIVYLTYITNE